MNEQLKQTVLLMLEEIIDKKIEEEANYDLNSATMKEALEYSAEWFMIAYYRTEKAY